MRNKDIFFGNQNILFTFAERNNSLPGGIPGKNMRISDSKQLNALATVSGKTAKQVSDIIVSELLNKKIIEDTPDNWGYPIAECYDRDITVTEIAGVIRAIGIDVVKSAHLDELLECVLIGDGDCPECGGDMEVTDGQYKQTGGFDYDSEPEYTPVWEETTCTHCGHRESNEPSY